VFGGLRDAIIVGSDQHSITYASAQGPFNHTLDHGLPRQFGQGFSGETRGSPARGDDSNEFGTSVGHQLIS
jgi:hypothetical protein